MTRSFITKRFFLLALGACLAVCVFSIALFERSWFEPAQGLLLKQLENNAVCAARHAAMLLKDPAASPSAVNDFLRETAEQAGAMMQIISLKGEVIASSAPGQEIANTGLFSAAELREAQPRGRTSRVRYNPYENGHEAVVVTPISFSPGRQNGQPMEKTFFLCSKARIEELYSARAFVIMMMLICLAACAVSLLPLSRLASRGLRKTIDRVSGALNAGAGGSFSTVAVDHPDDERGQLADAFNSMAMSSKRLIEAAEREKSTLLNVITSIKEGLVLIDGDEKIVLCNQSFNQLSGHPDPSKKFIWQVIMDIRLMDMLKAVKAQKAAAAIELNISDRTYLCSSSPAAGGHVIVFVDITEMKRLEKIKKDFVVNVSHELRTPLTAIKGYVETLYETASKEDKKFIDIIRRNTERLIHIVQDLLTLSNLEENGVRLDNAGVEVCQIAQRITALFHQKAAAKNVSLECECGTDIPVIKADSFKLEQVFVNLIDNALTYTEKGRVRVLVKKASAPDAGVQIEVSDTGMGIAREHLSRIFERFYVADPSRSKKLGGTGLGLSIVKHIVTLHGGTIDVTSEPGAGTTFTVVLPA